jgi:glycosyltransferase involved in cell wall biosynthesis
MKQRKDSGKVELSIVIPVFNEEENVGLLYDRLKAVLKELDKDYEIVFIDDGSSDNSFQVLKGLNKKNRDIKIIQFRKNFGQTAALAAGFDYARGEVIVTLDADLQNDPQDILLLLEKMNEGYDLVSGWRKNRQDPLLTRRVPSYFANCLISWFTGVGLHDYGCTLKAYKKEVVKNISLYGEMHRFIPALASWSGVSIAEVSVRHYRRKHGRSKYGLSRVIKVLLDLFTVKFLLSFSTKPIQIFGLWGIFSLFLGVISGVAVVLMKIIRSTNMTGNPLLYLTILCFIVGVQFIMMGLLGEIMVRTYHESQRKPIYIVKQIVES